MATDQECLEAWRRQRDPTNLQPLIERYGLLVFSSACRRLSRAEPAAEVTRAVFLVLARRARRLRTKTVLAGWLFHITALACHKLHGKSRRVRWWHRGRRKPASDLAADAPFWTRIASVLDAAMDRLPQAQRDAVLLRTLLNHDWAEVSRLLRTSETQAGKRVERGRRKLDRHFLKQGVPVSAAAWSLLGQPDPAAPAWPAALDSEILSSIKQSRAGRPSLSLARRVLNSLAWTRWRRRMVVGIPSAVLLLLLAAGLVLLIESRTGFSRLISMFFVWSVKQEAHTVPGLAAPARPWVVDAAHATLNATTVGPARDLYQTTNIWVAQLNFTAEQWRAVQPRRIEPLPHFVQPDGTILLRHPQAQRSGLAGVLGFDFNWASADFDFERRTFTNVAVRLKGNGTYLGSLYGDKRAFKVNLNKFSKGQKLGETDELTFNNLVNDFSCLSDALGYEFFREAGVPASRTAYAYLYASVTGRWERKPLGLYVMVEAVDDNFALERFGSKRTPIFKPVTYELFHYLGEDWSAYQDIYDLKTKATPAQQQRVIDFARLLTLADDLEFGRRLEEFLDLPKFARYLAVEVYLSNYDSFLSDGQNFLIYLNPDSNRFGFIPWDLDLCWGGFFLLGTALEREQASIWHPWVGQHRFLERVMAVEAFRKIYRAELEDLSTNLFQPRRLSSRIDELAQVIRGPITAESSFRLGKFEKAISDQRLKQSSKERGQGANRPVHQIKLFIEARAKSVRQQLAGKSNGVILQRQAGP